VISGRRTARETALLVLFSVDVGKDLDYTCALDNFQNHLRNDHELLTQLLGHSEYQPAPDALIERARKTLKPDGAHWQFVERMVRGVESHSTAIDELIERFSLNWKVSRMSRVDRNILRLAAYELAFESDVPSRATLNEAIEIAKRFSSEDSGKFVNGILDRIAQEFGRV
jgi:N utilization substance protein B